MCDSFTMIDAKNLRISSSITSQNQRNQTTHSTRVSTKSLHGDPSVTPLYKRNFALSRDLESTRTELARRRGRVHACIFHVELDIRILVAGSTALKDKPRQIPTHPTHLPFTPAVVFGIQTKLRVTTCTRDVSDSKDERFPASAKV